MENSSLFWFVCFSSFNRERNDEDAAVMLRSRFKREKRKDVREISETELYLYLCQNVCATFRIRNFSLKNLTTFGYVPKIIHNFTSASQAYKVYFSIIVYQLYIIPLPTTNLLELVTLYLQLIVIALSCGRCLEYKYLISLILHGNY